MNASRARTYLSSGLAGLGLLMGVGCSGPIDVDHVATAVIDGLVVDSNQIPLAEAGIRAVGQQYDCETEGPKGPVDGQAQSDGAGRFQIRLSSFLGSGGAACVDVVVTPASGGSNDTIRGVPALFFIGAVTDTTQATLESVH